MRAAFRWTPPRRSRSSACASPTHAARSRGAGRRRARRRVGRRRRRRARGLALSLRGWSARAAAVGGGPRGDRRDGRGHRRGRNRRRSGRSGSARPLAPRAGAGRVRRDRRRRSSRCSRTSSSARVLAGLVGARDIHVPGFLDGLVSAAPSASGTRWRRRSRPAAGSPRPGGARRLPWQWSTGLRQRPAGMALALAAAPLVGGLVNEIARSSPDAQLVLAPLGQLIGEPDFGPATRVVLSALRGRRLRRARSPGASRSGPNHALLTERSPNRSRLPHPSTAILLRGSWRS